MKNAKRLFIFLFAIMLCLSLVACLGGNDPCTEHVDDDGDNVCDKCNEEIDGGSALPDGEIALITGGSANFQIVKAADVPTTTSKKINDLVKALGKIGITVTVVEDSEATVKDCEILVGTVTSRGDEYKYDKHTLGPNGYLVKKVGTKILVLGGSNDTFLEAFEKFTEDILGYSKTTQSISNVTMKDDQSIIEIQDNYRVESIKINSVDIRDYTIAVDQSNSLYLEAAEKLQDLFYRKAGYWLEIVDLSSANKSVIIRSVSDAGSTGFRVFANSDNQMIIECAYDNCFEKSFNSFATSNIEAKFAPINFKNTKGVIHTEKISIVYYDDFGAAGDGVTNDFFAMKEAHDFANQSGQTVVATPGKTYLISSTAVKGLATYITIKTNTVWTDATIVIDDRNLSGNDSTKEYDTNIFSVQPIENKYYLSASQIAKLNETAITTDTKKLNITFDSDVLLLIENANHENYIRYGTDGYHGTNQKEIILVDKDGNISDTTPFMHDFSSITSVRVTRANLPELTITGGEVITRASRISTTVNGVKTSVYFKRGLSIDRSNTTVIGLKHKVTDELDFIEGTTTGPAYSGFFVGGFASHVTFDSCKLSGRKYYKIDGTYDFGAAYTNEIRLVNCDMYNFYLEDGKTISTINNTYWGVGGTNYCKNMIYDGCTLTRYDAHSGVYNGKIINCKLNKINVIGAGNLLIENTTMIQANTLISIRDDYGSTWNGTITIKNVTMDNTADVTVFNTLWANHDFGYDCYFPNVEIDGLKIKTSARVYFVSTYKINRDNKYFLYSLIDENTHLPTLKDGTTQNVNVYIPPQKVTITDTEGLTYVFPALTTFFANTEVTVNGKRPE